MLLVVWNLFHEWGYHNEEGLALEQRGDPGQKRVFVVEKGVDQLAGDEAVWLQWKRNDVVMFDVEQQISQFCGRNPCE